MLGCSLTNSTKKCNSKTKSHCLLRLAECETLCLGINLAASQEIKSKVVLCILTHVSESMLKNQYNPDRFSGLPLTLTLFVDQHISWCQIWDGMVVGVRRGWVCTGFWALSSIYNFQHSKANFPRNKKGECSLGALPDASPDKPWHWPTLGGLPYKGNYCPPWNLPCPDCDGWCLMEAWPIG